MNSSANKVRIVIGALIAVAAVQVLYAGVRELDTKKLTRAREVRATELAAAADLYAKAVQRANDKLAMTYKGVIKQYEAQSDTETAEALAKELEATLAETPAAAEGAEASAEKPAKGHIALINGIGPVVVNAAGDKGNARALASKQAMLIYFSAHWCGPCRAFTPKLVDFYRKNKGKNNFEVIFVSSDRSEKDMYGYMEEAGMPWVAVPFDRINASGLQARYGGNGIPNLVLIDREGKVVSGSYEGDNYVGPSKVLADFETLLRQQ